MDLGKAKKYAPKIPLHAENENENPQNNVLSNERLFKNLKTLGGAVSKTS
jgi:hypothetical protein